MGSVEITGKGWSDWWNGNGLSMGESLIILSFSE
jgi:hypothetical protein